MNKVYHLIVEAHSTRYGELREPRSEYSDIFMSHEEAYAEGKRVLTQKIESLYEDSDYCTNKDNGSTLADFLKDNMVRHRWIIEEVDLDILKTYNNRDNYRARRPAHMEYLYDLNGDLVSQCHWYYFDSVRDSGGTCFQYREGDDLPEAGTKFKVGDFVRLKRAWNRHPAPSFDTDTVFSIIGIPQRDKEGRLKENTYHIETVSERGEYLWDLNFHYPFQGIHETELVKHEGEVDKNSPLWFLHSVFISGQTDYKNTEEFEKGIIHKLERGKILLTPDITWQDIPELAHVAEGENI